MQTSLRSLRTSFVARIDASLTAQQCRWKHSSTQKKRFFYKNPARLRFERQNGIERYTPNVDKPTFEPVFEPRILPNGWSAPPGDDVTVPEYPFRVARTKNKPHDALGFLPVYTNYRKDGTKCTTRIKKIAGDRDLFMKELRAVLQIPHANHPSYDTVRTRVGGTIEVDGNHAKEIRQWLAGLGF